MKILMVSSEAVPFAKTGGLADVAGSLPAAVNKLNNKVSVVMPYYEMVEKNGFHPAVHKKNQEVVLGGKKYKFDILSLKNDNTMFYFIDNKDFYFRKNLYSEIGGDYEDNYLRFAFFSKTVAVSLNDLGNPDIIHCNDWQSAVLPLYLKQLFTSYPKTLYTIHNLAYQGVFDPAVMRNIDIPETLFNPEGLEFYGKVNFMKSGILYSDAVSTVSKKYSEEIQTKEFGCGLEGLLKANSKRLYGIINGVDYSQWNPENDEYIKKKYNFKSLKNKAKCKKDLLDYFNLKFDKKKPVIGMITRLAEQKGTDLVADSMDKILKQGAYFVLLGTGEERFHKIFEQIAGKHKGQVGIKIDFNNVLAHKIEAGSDIFLMPSRYEPCGLNQMYSLKYATVPVVRATGGLDDTIIDFRYDSKRGNGFKFKQASPEALYETIKEAIEMFKDKKAWEQIQKNGLNCDFSWENSAKHYVELYESILKGEYHVSGVSGYNSSFSSAGR